MRRTLALVLLLSPFLTFAQLSNKEKTNITNYSNDICDCVNGIMKKADPNALNFLQVMNEEGEEASNKVILEFVASASEENKEKFLTSLNWMASEEFNKELLGCDKDIEVGEVASNQIMNQKGPAYDYFVQHLASVEGCSMVKFFYDKGLEARNN